MSGFWKQTLHKACSGTNAALVHFPSSPASAFATLPLSNGELALAVLFRDLFQQSKAHTVGLSVVKVSQCTVMLHVARCAGRDKREGLTLTLEGEKDCPASLASSHTGDQHWHAGGPAESARWRGRRRAQRYRGLVRALLVYQQERCIASGRAQVSSRASLLTDADRTLENAVELLAGPDEAVGLVAEAVCRVP
jgi:hypothetical protein